MSFRGTPRGRGGFRGSFRGGGRFENAGPPEEVAEAGTFLHPCQEEIVCKMTSEKVPYFNAPIYLHNKEVGKIDEIFGPIKDAFYIDSYKFLTLDRVLNPTSSRGRGRGRGDSRGGRGGRGDSRGGRGGRGDFRGGRGGRGDFRGGRGDFRGGRGDFRGGRGDFRGGRGDFRGGRGDFRGGRGDRGGAGNNSFQGKRPTDSPSTQGMGKKIKFDE